ncbi:DEAD/DEAH box helicase [Halalkaliarchaeum sp. AArc-GB]|uniref:DEAD/DEAH box helicase n=1 Tax=Halalkaliarchaeum sp. AArc-GB TaxID=3074078 RepID=UPI00285664CE|nr:DEAD/DEAH box helicase [Halalkaliarchaeum sp. AArc-GB]MDR5672279.1 DEAD/DEAH box helicase [Halalkaliarchaeum sp. AArc-GB]
MDDLLSWLRDRPYYEGQIVAHERRPARDPQFSDLDLEPRLESALAERGIASLYAHQADAIEEIRKGYDVVLATETASGKSLAYTVPAFERAMDHGGRTLYLGPQNALIADQLETLSELARGLGFGSRVSVDQYTGRLSKTEKREVRDRRPTVLLSNPDMVHYALLPHAHRLWEWLFSSLELVVVDEVHSYRGVFGSQMALTLRRLRRLCERFGSDPQFVCCSATIGNPVEHASRVTGRPAEGFRLVDTDASGRGPRHWILWNPPEYDADWSDRTPGDSGRRRSSHVESMRLFVDLLVRGHQTLSFTRARQTAERYAQESTRELRERGHHDLAGAVQAYQGSLRGDRRRSIERQLDAGEIRGVWSTNALELGVDVGGLDAVILDGYPGTRMETFQRAGRAGRGSEPAAVVMVAGEDQLDQYLMGHPNELFDGDPEEAITDPENGRLLRNHVPCAATENWLSPDDEAYFGESFPDVVSDLEAAGTLSRRETDAGLRWLFDGDGSPQHGMSLRTIDDREVDLLDRRDGEVIASLGFSDALRDAHPGAIYHHQGETYEVAELDLDRDVAELTPTWADYYTRVLTDKTIVVDEDRKRRPLPARPETTVRFADLTVTERVTGYERRDGSTGEPLGRVDLDLPETTLSTTGLYVTVPPDVEQDMRAFGTGDAGDAGGTNGEWALAGGIHAAEHGVISLFPLAFLCDRADVGGLSTPCHPHTDRATVFVYDGYPGGVGLTRRGFDVAESLFERTARLIDGCGCEDGCPACVQSPHCGNANEPLAPEPAALLLSKLVGTQLDL